jgi:PTH1 family peptidyl-tRNA hydrolase
MANIFDLFKKIEKESAPSAPVTHIVCGLGNPGDKYVCTRHNAGFVALDYLAKEMGVTCNKIKFKALTGECTINGVRVLLMKPQTYMNASGEAVSEAAAFYKIPSENIIVISDDIMQNIGRLRIRKSGSAGGQKGLKSIIEKLGTENFPRLRMGVGAKPHPDYDLASWVLSNFSKSEMELLRGAIGCAEEGIRMILKDQFDNAVQHCNSYPMIPTSSSNGKGE